MAQYCFVVPVAQKGIWIRFFILLRIGILQVTSSDSEITYNLKMLIETLLGIPFSVIGRCSLVPTSH
jgi:hypothetical protein